MGCEVLSASMVHLIEDLAGYWRRFLQQHVAAGIVPSGK
jgi:hypothetical protein